MSNGNVQSQVMPVRDSKLTRLRRTLLTPSTVRGIAALGVAAQLWDADSAQTITSVGFLGLTALFDIFGEG